MISEYDNRQLDLMLEKIKLYMKDKIRLDTLITDLEELSNCLQEVSKEWSNTFLNVWTKLEIIYAGALYHDRQYLTRSEINDVSNILRQLESIVTRAKDSGAFDK